MQKLLSPSLIICALLSLYAPQALALPGMTATVPAGVRALVYHYVHGDVPGSFGDTGVEKSLSVNATLGSSILRNISPETSAAYDELAKIDSNLANSLDLGRVDLDPKVSANINAFGLAWGVTDNIMVGADVPFYDAKVSLSGGFSPTDSMSKTVARLQQYAKDPTVTQKTRDSANVLAQVLSQLPSLQGAYLQGAVVNDYGYKPIGNWAGRGMGDFDLFTQWHFLETPYYAQAVKVGHSLPTGRADDPDNLVDIPFGTGYHSTYVDSIHDILIWKEAALLFTFDAKYQYNWSTEREYRLVPSADFPLSKTKEKIDYKPGDQWSVTGDIGSKIWGGISWETSYTLKNKSTDSAHGVDNSYNYDLLTDTSNSSSHTVFAGLIYSTVEDFKRKKFPIPLIVELEASRVISGVNTEKLNTYALDFKLFF